MSGSRLIRRIGSSSWWYVVAAAAIVGGGWITVRAYIDQYLQTSWCRDHAMEAAGLIRFEDA